MLELHLVVIMTILSYVYYIAHLDKRLVAQTPGKTWE